jgi:hypothetical protein
MSETLNSFQQNAEATFKSNGDFHFPGFDQPLESANENEPDSLSYPCLQLVPKGETSPRLKFVFKNGHRIAIPYIYILRVEFDPAGKLSIITAKQTFVIEGRGLDFLEERLFEGQLVAIKESKSTFDPGQYLVYLKRIEVRDRQRN